jgi:ABC-type glycerol-3-phosphate transport system substrate-binding protein
MKRVIVLLCLIVLLTGGVFAASKTLRLWSMAFPPHVTGLQAVIDAFQQRNPDITVKIAAGVVPDLWLLVGYDVLEQAATGALAPLGDIVSIQTMKDTMWPESWQQQPFDQPYVLGISDPQGDIGLIANVGMFKEAGLTVPAKFDSTEQLVEYAQKLSRTDAQGNLIRGGVSFREFNLPYYLLSYIADLGGKFYDNKSQKFTLRTPEAKKVLQFFYDLNWKYKVDSPNLPDAFTALAQGTTAMSFLWPEFVSWARINLPKEEFTLIVKPPFVKGKEPKFGHIDGWNIGASAKSKNLAEVKKFLAFFLTPEAQMIFVKKNPGFSPLKSLAKDPWYDSPDGKFLKPVLSMLPRTKMWGPFGNDNPICAKAAEVIENVVNKTMTVDEGLAQWEKEANLQMDQFYLKFPKLNRPTIEY